MGAFNVLTVNANYINVNQQSTHGLDYDVRYEHEFNFGKLLIDIKATQTMEDVAQLRVRMGADIPIVGAAAIGQSLQMKIVVADGLGCLAEQEEFWNINRLVELIAHRDRFLSGQNNPTLWFARPSP